MKWLSDNAKWLAPLIVANILGGAVALNTLENRLVVCEAGYTGAVQQLKVFVDQLRHHSH